MNDANILDWGEYTKNPKKNLTKEEAKALKKKAGKPPPWDNKALKQPERQESWENQFTFAFGPAKIRKMDAIRQGWSLTCKKESHVYDTKNIDQEILQ